MLLIPQRGSRALLNLQSGRSALDGKNEDAESESNGLKHPASGQTLVHRCTYVGETSQEDDRRL